MIRVWCKTRWQTPPDPHPYGNADTYWLMDVSMDTCHRGDRHHVSLSAVPSESKRASKAAGREVWRNGHEQKKCCVYLTANAAVFLWRSPPSCEPVSLLHRSVGGHIHLCPFSFLSSSFLIQLSLSIPAWPSLQGRGYDGLIYHSIENQLNYSFSLSLYIFPNWLLAIQVSTVSAA